MSPGRGRLAIIALAIGAFGIGTTEFVTMGLLPEITRDLLPGLYATDQEQALSYGGWLVTAYALGVVVGAPLVALLGARYPRRGLLLVLLGWFVVATSATALMPVLPLAVAGRFVSALPHGAYFGIAGLVAAELLGPRRRAQAISLVLSGLTVANIVGVSFVSWVGQQAGWRAAMLCVAAVFALTLLAVGLTVPATPADPRATVRSELRALRRGRLWLALATGGIGFAGFFGLYTYITPLATEVAGLPAASVPWLLATLGLGMTAGSLLAGRLIDRKPRATMYGSFAGMILCLCLLGLTAASPLCVFLFGFLSCVFVFGVVPSIQLRLMDTARDAQTIAASLSHAAMNIGNAFGSFAAALVVGAGLGFVAPVWLGAVLAAAGVAIAAASYAIDRRRPLVAAPEVR